MPEFQTKNDVSIGTKFCVNKEVTSSWGWVLSEGEMVELLQIQFQPTRFKVKDSKNREWILDTHDVEIESDQAAKPAEETAA